MRFFKDKAKREQFKKFEAKDPSFLKKIVGGEDDKAGTISGDQKVKL